MFRAGISKEARQSILDLHGELEYGVDCIPIQTFATGENPKPPKKRGTQSDEGPTAKKQTYQEEVEQLKNLVKTLQERQRKTTSTSATATTATTVTSSPSILGKGPTASMSTPKPSKVTEKPPSEVKNTSKLWDLANELAIEPEGALKSNIYWLMRSDDRKLYRDEFERRFGFVPFLYNQARKKDREAIELQRRRRDTYIRLRLLFPGHTFDPEGYKQHEANNLLQIRSQFK